MKKRSWKDWGALLGLLGVWAVCAAANTGMAWFDYGGPLPFNVAATGLYLAVVTALTVACWKVHAWAKTMWRFSWLSAVCGLVCWFCSLDQRAWGLLFAPLAAIPFYGLRAWMNWELTYLCGAGIALAWVMLTWRGWRMARGKDAGKKATLYFLAKCAGIAVLCVALFFVNAFAGNPVSALMARGTAHRYVNSKYAALDVQIDKVGYNLKDTNYYAKVSSPTSVDTHFTVYISMLGAVERDTYYSDVVEGGNTWARLNNTYMEQVREVLAGMPFESDGGFGDFRGSYNEYLPGMEGFALSREGLELDGEYDLQVLGAKHGSISYRVLDEDVSCRRAAEVLTCLRDELEKAGMSCYAVNLTLRHPRDEDGKWSGPELRLTDFLRTDLYGDDLEEKIEEACQWTADISVA